MARKRILITDDDCDFLESLQLVLLNDGYNVYTATNGHDAIAQYVEIKPHLVFLDIKMPGIDGYETFLRIKNIDSNAKIVFTSSYVLDHTKYEDVKTKSLAGIINKPIEPDILRKMITKHAK